MNETTGNEFTCDICRDLIPLLKDGAASSDSEAAVKQHIENCSECAGIFDEGSALEMPEMPKASENMPKKAPAKRWFSFVYIALLLPGVFFVLNHYDAPKSFVCWLIMLFAGVFGYLVFRWREVYILPVILSVSYVVWNGITPLNSEKAYKFNMPEFVIGYYLLALIGMVITVLLRFAFGKKKISVNNIAGSWKKRLYSVLSNHLRLYRVIAAVIASAMIIWVMQYANRSTDYPLYYPYVKIKAQQYVAENYGDKGFVIKNFFHSGSTIFARVERPGSIDSNFRVFLTPKGIVDLDTYEKDVVKCENARLRLDIQYKHLIENFFEGSFFPYSKRYVAGSLVIERKQPGQSYTETPEGMVPENILVPHRSYDLQKLGEIGGYITVTIDTDQVTPEYAAEVLLRLGSLLRQGDIPYYAINLELIDYSLEIDDRKVYSLTDFRRSDIYEEGLVERVILNAEKS